MRDEELRRRIEAVAEHVVPPTTAPDHRTGWALAGRGASLENSCVPPIRRCHDDGALLVTTTGGTTWSDATPAG